MKKLLLSTVMVLFGVFAIAQNAPEKQAEITFENLTHDFGTFPEGSQPSHEFVFTNTGNAALILSAVNPACGCTTPEWPREPIMPGQSSKIKVIYNSSGRPGSFTKMISITSNAKNASMTLTIKGNAEPKKVEPASPVQNPGH
jgi:hypothetical protein